MKRIAVLSLLLAGCGFFSKSQSKFYSLDRIPPATAPVAVRGLPVALDGVELPPGLDRREIVVRLANQQLQVRSAEQWSASLQPLVLHTLAFDLADRLPEGMVILPGASRPSGLLRAIDVVFEDFTAGPDTKVVLDGRWIMRVSGQPDVTHHERISIDIPSLDSANVASGTSQALAALADRIAAQLR
ncbi:MAG: uncharacterized protein QOE68_2904 [Thermoanaerobaculia bacterium]|jgi:uncharacterized lipoprotein YmbA|nr:uncharacterized protein [Thermoanaerobaculia bacterium]